MDEREGSQPKANMNSGVDPVTTLGIVEPNYSETLKGQTKTNRYEKVVNYN